MVNPSALNPTSSEPRVVAVDWSGRRGPDQKRFIWVAEAVDGVLVRLEDGRSRREIVEWLIDEARRDANLIVGIDSAFSLPAWYLSERGLTAKELWALLAEEALTPTMKELGLADWFENPEPPFWRRAKVAAGLTPAKEFRRTDALARAAGAPAKSVFQLVGAGRVGRGSLYGMQAVHRLSAEGFHVWPFDRPDLPLVVEIYPRLFMGPTVKSSSTERARLLESVPIASKFRDLAVASEDAFDAAVSAIGMGRAIDELAHLPEEPGFTLEGKMWPPDLRDVRLRAERTRATSREAPAEPAPDIAPTTSTVGPGSTAGPREANAPALARQYGRLLRRRR